MANYMRDFAWGDARNDMPGIDPLLVPTLPGEMFAIMRRRQVLVK
jgi:hypothetical protein